MGRLTDTVSGGIATFRTPYKQDIRSLKAYFSPWQEGSGTPSPSNIRAIRGWMGAEAYHAKNLFEKNQSINGYRLDTSGKNYSSSSANYYVSSFVPVVAGQTYTKNSPAADAYHRFCTYSQADQNTYIRRVEANTITIQSGEAYIRFCGEIAEKDTAQLFETEKIYTLPVDWTTEAGEVYGGYVDLVTGEVWETWHKMVVDSNTPIGLFPWGGIKTDAATGTEYVTALFRRSAEHPRAYNVSENMCDMLPYSTNQSKLNIAYFYDGDSYGPAISLPTSLIGTTHETLAQYLADKEFTFVYKLRQPVLLTTLTPTALRTFIGTNNILCNTGDVEVAYDFAESREMWEARKRVMGFDAAKRKQLQSI